MMPSVIFPDVEKILTVALKNELDNRTEVYTADVHVSTIKPGPDVKPYPRRIVTIRSDGGQKLDWVRKLERVGINVYADTYADASDLAHLIEALSVSLTGNEIKLSRVALSPTRVNEEGPQQSRYLVLELTIKGSSL